MSSQASDLPSLWEERSLCCCVPEPNCISSCRPYCISIYTQEAASQRKPARVREASVEAHVLQCKTDSPAVSKATCPVVLKVEGLSQAVTLQVYTGAICSILSTEYARRLFKGRT